MHIKTLVAIFTASLACTALGVTPKEIAARILPAVVDITVYDANNLPSAEGSGFFFEKNLIVTNYHVMRGGSRARAKIVGTSTSFDLRDVVSSDQTHDLVLLKTDTSHDNVLTLTTTATSVGDVVFVAGNPGGLEGTFSNGLISGKRLTAGVELLQISAPISPGSSGGPVVNDQCQVVGVAVSTMRFGQNLNFAIPAELIRTLERKESRSIQSVFGGIVTPPERISETKIDDFFSADGIVSAYALTIEGSGFSLTIRNNGGVRIWSVSYMVIAYDNVGRPIDNSGELTESSVIPANLAKRIRGRFTNSLPLSIIAKYEIRILRYRVVPTSGGAGTYRVVAGDTVAKIAKRYRVTPLELLAVNPWLDPSHLRIGDTLQIPTEARAGE